jgi:hypothetical protein
VDFTDETGLESTILCKESFVCMDEALLIAKSFMEWNQGVSTKVLPENTRSLRSTSVIKSENKYRNGKIVCDTLMYVFNFDKGFTIVSATKDAHQILAYSDIDSFDENDTENIGQNIWLEYIKNTIEKVIDNPSEKENMMDAYNTIKFTENIIDHIQTRGWVFFDEIRFYEEVGPLLTTAWHQDWPYDTFTPIVNGSHVPVGCVPIAVSQVVNYRQKLSGESINWGAISLKDTSEITNLMQILFYGIGMSTVMDIHGDAQSHPSLCFPDFFCYRSRITNYLNSKGYYTNWVDLGNQTPITLPAIYEGFESCFLGLTDWFGGHWWVLDGYRKYEKWYGWAEEANMSPAPPTKGGEHEPPLMVWGYLFLHFNFGWKSTSSNTWYGVSGSYLDFCKNFKRLDLF